MAAQMLTDNAASIQQTIELAAARDSGLIRYFTGKPCRRGHISERAVSSRSCVKCDIERVKIWQRNNAGKASRWAKKAQQNFRRDKPERSKEIKAGYRKRNREKLRVDSAAYFGANRERYAENKKHYRANKPWVIAENQRAREAQKAQAMPWWADRDAIRAVYKLAQEMTEQTGVRYSVDHIYPLRGRNSCGLHVHWNLQVITLSENCSKGNKSPEEWGVS